MVKNKLLSNINIKDNRLWEVIDSINESKHRMRLMNCVFQQYFEQLGHDERKAICECLKGLKEAVDEIIVMGELETKER